MGRSFQGATDFAQTADRSQPSLGSLLILCEVEGVDDDLLELSRSWTSPIEEDDVEDAGDDAASACDLSRSTNRGLSE